jgi:cation:H+ antiporter
LFTGLFLVGLLERNNRTIGRVGIDSAAVLVLFVGGIGALATI